MNNIRTIGRWGAVLAIVAVGLLACLQLRIKDDAVDLLPGEAVRGDIRQLQRMGLVDRVFLTLSLGGSDTQEASSGKLRESALKLGKKLSESGHFSYVLARLPEGYEFALFQRLQASLPLLLDSADIEKLVDKTSPQGIRDGLEKSFALLNSPSGIALKRQVQRDPLGMVSLALEKLNHLRSEFSMRIEDGFFMSWDGRSCLLVAESRDPLTNAQNASAIQSFLEEAYDEVLPEGVEARVIGSLPHTLANSQSIQRDLRLLLPAATLLLLLLLGFTLRDIRAVVVFIVPFLAAPPAIGLTSLLYGDITGLALGFGIVLLGIAVDFSIHLYLALMGGGVRQEIMKEVGRPMLFAGLTTVGVFVVLLFSEVASHRQMAMLALFGVILAVIFAWLLIPTIVKTRPVSKGSLTGNGTIPFIPLRRPGLVVAGWLLFVTLGLLAWPQLRYNGDLRALDVPGKQVLDDEHHFSATWGKRGEQAFIVAEGATLAEVLDRNARVGAFLKDKRTYEFQSFAPLLPGPATQEENWRGWQNFWAGMRPEFDQRFIAESLPLGFTRQAFEPFLSWLDRPPEPLSPESFLGGPLQPLFASMLKTPADKGGRDKDDNRYLAMTTVAIDEATLPALLQFAEQEPQVTVLAALKWRAEVERLLRHDIVTLSLAAGMIIVLLVAFQFRRFRAVIAVLAPVLSALSAMSLYCYIHDGQLNMMHLIMGIMVIGLSVDYGIFIVCSQLTPSAMISAKAVSICAASSLIGFGVLSFAAHPALQALGITVLIGIGAAWPAALLVSPALLAIGRKE